MMRFLLTKAYLFRYLYAPAGTLLKEGEVLKRPKLAQTYKRLAKEGADLFYT